MPSLPSNMPLHCRWLLIFTLWAQVCSPIHAQSGNGGLRGSLIDADFSVPVSGATVVLEGSSRSAQTGEDGSFFINDIPPGQYAVLISKEGFIRERRSDIVVTSGSIKEIEFEMTAEVVELDEFVVTQEEIIDTSSSAVTVDIRRDLTSFTDVMGRDFITQTGASDAAKLLAKTTGVNVSEGKFVVVRGLSDRYNSVTLNGLRVPSSDPDRRAVALDLFPSTVIEDVRTNKTFLPNMPGEATGAGIDIRTRSVPEKNFFNFKIGSGYNSNVTGNDGFLSYKGGGTGLFGTSQDRRIPGFLRAASELPGPGQDGYTDTPADRAFRQRVNNALSPVMGTQEKSAPLDYTIEASMGIRGEFMGAPAGITVAVDYSKKFTGNNNDLIGRYDFSQAAGDLGLVNVIRRQATVHNGQETMRAGMLVSLGIELDTDSQITATYFFNRVAEDRAALQFGVDPDQNPGILDYRESILYTERQLRVFQLEGSHLLDEEHDFKFDWALSYNQSSQLEPDSRFVNSRVDEASGNFFQPPFTAVPPFQRFWRELNDENYSARMDVETRILGGEEDGLVVKMKFGGLLDYSDRNYRADSFAYNPGLDNSGFPTTAVPAFLGYPGFLGKPKVFPEQTWGDVFLEGNVPVTDVTNSSFATFLFRANDPETYAASQMISAGYLMFDLDLGAGINVTFGARAETTDLKTQATPIYTYIEEGTRFALLSAEQRTDLEYQTLVNAAFNGDVAAQNDPRLVARSRASISETALLPALSASWDYADNQRVRGAISRTIARPSFKELSPIAFVNVESGDIFIGNADLQTSDITNFDSRWEWFPEAGSMIGVSFFAKNIDRPIELSQDGDFQRFINVESARVYGMELEFQRGLGFIAEELSHFSVGANYSYIKSSATRPEIGRQSIYGPTRRLQGQPDYIFNTNLIYDNPDTGWNFGAFLNVVGPQLFAVAFNYQDPDILQEPFTTLDLSVSKKVGKNAKLTFRAQNLLNETLIRYYNNPQRPVHSTRSPGINYSVSLNLSW